MNNIIRLDNYRLPGSKDDKYLNCGMEISSEFDLQEVPAEDTNDFLQFGGQHTMDESTKMMIDRLDQDAREREERYHKDAQEREQRYRTEMFEQNRLFGQEAKEREERMLNIVQELRSDLQDVKDDFRTTRNTIIALTLSVILGVAAMVLAIVLAR